MRVWERQTRRLLSVAGDIFNPAAKANIRVSVTQTPRALVPRERRSCTFLTSAVRPLVPAIAAIGRPIAQFAHMDAHIGVQAPVFVDRTLVHPIVCAWETNTNEGKC